MHCHIIATVIVLVHTAVAFGLIIRKLPETPEEQAREVADGMATLDLDYAIEPIKKIEEIAMTFAATKKDQQLEKFPMSPQIIAKEQQKDKTIQRSLATRLDAYT